MRVDFSTKLKGVLRGISEVKRDLQAYSSRLDEAEECISMVEDTAVKTTTEKLEKQVADLNSKLNSLENHHRSNLRLVNLPEKVENGDSFAFLWRWLPEALGPDNVPDPLRIERAHRLPAPTGPRNHHSPLESLS